MVTWTDCFYRIWCIAYKTRLQLFYEIYKNTYKSFEFVDTLAYIDTKVFDTKVYKGICHVSAKEIDGNVLSSVSKWSKPCRLLPGIRNIHNGATTVKNINNSHTFTPKQWRGLC